MFQSASSVPTLLAILQDHMRVEHSPVWSGKSSIDGWYSQCRDQIPKDSSKSKNTFEIVGMFRCKLRDRHVPLVSWILCHHRGIRRSWPPTAPMPLPPASYYFQPALGPNADIFRLEFVSIWLSYTTLISGSCVRAASWFQVEDSPVLRPVLGLGDFTVITNCQSNVDLLICQFSFFFYRRHLTVHAA